MYGTKMAFPENEFFEVLVDLTYPEIENFFNDYIKGEEKLPISTYFEKIGIMYNPSSNSFNLNENRTGSQQLLFDSWRVNL